MATVTTLNARQPAQARKSRKARKARKPALQRSAHVDLQALATLLQLCRTMEQLGTTMANRVGDCIDALLETNGYTADELHGAALNAPPVKLD